MWIISLFLFGTIVSPVFSQCDFRYNLPISGSYNLKLPFYPLPFAINPSYVYCSWELYAPTNAIAITISCPTFNVVQSTYCYEDSFAILGSDHTYCGQGTLEYKSYSNIFRASYFSPIGRYAQLDCFIYVSEYFGEPEKSSTISNTSSRPPTDQPSDPFDDMTCKCGRRQEQRIVDGVETGVHEFPWQAVLYNKEGKHFCGATLIGSKWVLTAAHCVDYITEITVGLGEHHLHQTNDTENTVYMAVVRVIKHEEYNLEGVPNNDIAILQLSASVTYTKDIHPSCLPFNFDDSVPHIGTVTGWGATEYHGKTSQYLQEVDVPIISSEECTLKYGTLYNPETMICSYEEGKDSCQGDSGGPLTVDIDGSSQIVGVVSWGYGCGFTDSPGVYARVSFYIDWIKSKIGSNEICTP